MSTTPIDRFRSTAARLDRPLMLAATGIIIIGSFMVWSATRHNTTLTGGDGNAFLLRHVINVVIGLVLFVGVLAIDHRWMRILAPVIYLGSLFGILLVPVIGTTVNGARSWLRFGGMSIEPSEFVKFALALMAAMVIAERTEASRSRVVGNVEVIVVIGLYAVPAGIIMLQPDLGSTLVLSAMAFGILGVAGVSGRWLGGLVTAVALAAVVVVVGHLLKPYQLNRLLAFTNPKLDPRGAGYNTTQARIAIGNGGVFGRGLFDGSQTQSGFVPEQHTDFVFTVAGEEFGLIGAGLLIALFGLLVWRILRIAARSDDMFGRVAAAGIACWLAFEAFQNVGMCLGIMPVTGIPLPLVSYGGTAMFATMMGLGVVQSIHLRSARLLR